METFWKQFRAICKPGRPAWQRFRYRISGGNVEFVMLFDVIFRIELGLLGCFWAHYRVLRLALMFLACPHACKLLLGAKYRWQEETIMNGTKYVSFGRNTLIWVMNGTFWFITVSSSFRYFASRRSLETSGHAKSIYASRQTRWCAQKLPGGPGSLRKISPKYITKINISPDIRYWNRCQAGLSGL